MVYNFLNIAAAYNRFSTN